MISKQQAKEIKKSILHYLCDDFKGNQAIFDKEEGFANYSGTDLDMVMEKVVSGIYKCIGEDSKPVTNQWITCIERLPDDYVKVLTCDKEGNFHVLSHCKEYVYPFCIQPSHPRYNMPVAWQPLPQKYKGITK